MVAPQAFVRAALRYHVSRDASRACFFVELNVGPIKHPTRLGWQGSPLGEQGRRRYDGGRQAAEYRRDTNGPASSLAILVLFNGQAQLRRVKRHCRVPVPASALPVPHGPSTW